MFGNYHVVISFSDGRDADASLLIKRLELLIQDFLARPEESLQIFLQPNEPTPRSMKNGPLSIIHLAGTRPHSLTPSLRRLIRFGADCIPVYPDTANLAEALPTELAPFNGVPVRGSFGTDPQACDRTVAEVLKTLGLTRRPSRAFISYRRGEGDAAAHLLFEALSARVYDVFLDTHKIHPGERFANLIRHRISDSDILIFLESASAATSPWVEMELEHAAAAGVGRLRIRWPSAQEIGWSSLAGIESADLTEDDFLGATMNGQFAPHALKRLIDQIEGTRLKSAAARDRRVLGVVWSELQQRGLECKRGPRNYIQFRSKQGTTHIVHLPAGVPRSRSFEKVADSAQNVFSSPSAERSIVHESLGVIADWKRHLIWLSDSLDTQLVSIDDVSDWLDRIN